MSGWLIPDNAEISEIWLSERYKYVRLVNPASGVIFDIWLSLRYNIVSFVNPASTERSESEIRLF